MAERNRSHMQYDEENWFVVTDRARSVWKEAPENLADPVFIERRIRKDPWILFHAAETLRDDREVMLRLVSLNGEALRYGRKKFQADREVVLTAIRNQPKALRYASGALRADRQVAEAAVKENGSALRLVDRSIRMEKPLVLKALGCRRRLSPSEMEDILEHLSEDLRKDDDVIRTVLCRYGVLIRWFGEPVISNRDHALRAIQTNPTALAFLSDTLRGDRDLVLEAVVARGKVLAFASEACKRDRQVVLAAVSSEGRALMEADPSFFRDREIFLKALETDGTLMEAAPEELRQDRETVLRAVKRSGEAFRYVPEVFRKDREIVHAAVSHSGNLLKLVPRELYGNRPIALAAMMTAGGLLQELPDALHRDPEILRTAVENEGNALRYGVRELREDPEILRAALLSDLRPVAWRETAVREKWPTVTVAKKAIELQGSLAQPQLPYIPVRYWKEWDLIPDLCMRRRKEELLLPFLANKNERKKLMGFLNGNGQDTVTLRCEYWLRDERAEVSALLQELGVRIRFVSQDSWILFRG